MLLVLALQGCGQGKNKTSATDKSNIGTNNNSVNAKAVDFEVVDDPVKKFNETEIRAEQGDAKAQYDLGVIYAKGTGVEKDVAKSFEWFHKAAEQGIVGAQIEIAWMYKKGKGVQQDFGESVKWYQKAAEQGNVDAQYALGGMYDKADGVPKDMAKAAKWYHMAADQGNATAQGRLGMMYLTADGVERNYSEAFKFCSEAAKQGDQTGLEGLSICYDGGFGVPVDYAKAAEIIRKFAEAGDKYEQRNLGMDCEQGHGVKQDFVEAYKWYNLAASGEDISMLNFLKASGLEPPSKMRDRLAQQMTPEQIAEAQQLAREFKPHKESGSDNSISPENPTASGTGFFITDDGYLISNYHVVKDATKVRLVTSAGMVDAKVIQVDVANDLALLKADGIPRGGTPLPIATSRSAHLGGTVATVGFPDPSLQGFSPKLAKGEIASLSGAGDDPRYFQISVVFADGHHAAGQMAGRASSAGG
jgi:hypothetical protein